MMSQKDDLKKIDEAADTIFKTCQQKPSIAIVLGSGLGPMANKTKTLTKLNYTDIPHFLPSTVKGHEGVLSVNDISGMPVYLLKGRYHYYEGYDIKTVTFPIRVLAKLGVTTLLLTNAAGAINPSFEIGDLMLLTDHLSLFCPPCLRGPNLDVFGPRFLDQTNVYSPTLRRFFLDAAEDLSIKLREGVYGYAKGPQYETPADIRAFATLGADAVGMSTVPEAMIASHSGMRVVGLSCLTNKAAGLSGERLSHEDVVTVGKAASDRAIRLVERAVLKMK